MRAGISSQKLIVLLTLTATSLHFARNGFEIMYHNYRGIGLDCEG